MGVITCGIGWLAWQFLDFSNKGQVIIFAIAMAIIVLIETGVGIWALVRHEQVDTLSSTRHEEIFALAVTDEKSIYMKCEKNFNRAYFDSINNLIISFIACTTCYVRIYKDRMERRASEMAMRTSLQDTKETDTKNNLLIRQSKYSHNSGSP
ncbi:hypothetical protein ALC57_02440 [Trachymyrmex cornetzi]|uniref:Uncharacterized protein n=1 Tax=Trachymyrmex cornetzi TaxID=471704 RepID=A0A151JNW4_9HYME|nr:hypothetical protein ALC57_02440 [Trachymyrmex cornetzi]